MHWTVVLLAVIGGLSIIAGMTWVTAKITKFVQNVRHHDGLLDYHDRRISNICNECSNLYKKIHKLEKEVNELRVQNTPHNEEDRQVKGE